MDPRKLQHVRLVVAYLYQREGAGSISESKLWRTMAFDLNWLPPKDARTFAQALPRTGLVTREEDGGLRPNFDVKATKVPFDVRVDADLVRAMPAEGTMLSPPDDAPASGTPAGGEAKPVKTAKTAKTAQAAEARKAPPTPPPPRAAAHDEHEVEAPQTQFGQLLHALAERTGEPVQTWVERMNASAAASQGLLTPEAALLLAAAGRGVDVTREARALADAR